MRIISVKVKPNARQSKLEEQTDGTYLAHVKAVPVDGKANAELISLIASHFGVRKADVEIKTGSAGRMKRIELNID